MKAQPLALVREHPIDHQRMDMYIQIQGAAEALNTQARRESEHSSFQRRHAAAPRAAKRL
jgi:hypothetical protein